MLNNETFLQIDNSNAIVQKLTNLEDFRDRPNINICEVIENHAKQQPDAIAIRFQDSSLTYLELDQKANQLAHHLTSLGVGAEVRVGAFFRPSLDFGIVLLSIFKLGGVYIPLDANYPQDRLAMILEDTQPQVILTHEDLLPNLPAIASNISTIFCCDRDGHSIKNLPTEYLSSNINLAQTAYIIYTSGTTGKPKGVMISYQNLHHYVFVAQQQFGFDRDTIMAAIARFSFSITFFELLSPLVAGGTLVLLEREHILDFHQMCRTLEEINTIHASPNLLKKLLSYIEDRAIDISRFNSLRHVSTGGDLVPIDVLESMQRNFQNAEIYVIYGCSEVSCMACTSFVSREHPVTKTLVGKAFVDVEVRLYDSEQNLVPAGTIGEVYISGAGVSKGYLHQPELTAEKFITIDHQRFYRTGDRGRFDSDGNLEILGRVDFQIKLNGIRIEPAEIEILLRQIAGVRESVVVLRELNSGELGIVAYVVLNPINPPKTADIRQFLQSQLPDYMVPSAFVALDSLPLTLNGKIDRHALPTPTNLRQDATENFVTPRNELEVQLTKIWEDLLGIKPIGIQDNFFDLGGSSFVAIRLFYEIEKTWGKLFPLSTLLQKQTIEQLADILSSKDWTPSWESLVPMQTKGSKTPLFCIHAIGGYVLEYAELARYLGKDRPIYGLQSVGLNSPQDPLFRVADMASYYLQEIRTIQPHGPYLFFGYSFGGIIAFEMAQQLNDLGEAIGFLGVCDLESPNTIRESNLSFASFVKVNLRNIWKIKGIKEKVKYVFERISKILTYKSYGKYMEKEFSKIEIPPPDSLIELVKSNIQAHRDYSAKVYSGSLSLFRCKVHSLDHYFTPDLGWSEIVKGGVSIHYLTGHHFELLKQPTVETLAKEIKSYLDNIDL